MIGNTVANTVNYFYPLGNTPPVSLTQDLPPESEADILLLGCGDARNVLFTCFADPGRKFDITCCDIEPAVLARNVLLYTLVIDDAQTVCEDQIWNIYYHWQIDDKSLQLLEDQLAKLLPLSQSLTKWHASLYGNRLRFCNDSTLRKVREFWASCSSLELAATEKLRRDNSFQMKIEKAKKIRHKVLGDGTSLGCVRSVAPTGFQGIQDFSTVEKTWWREGTTTPQKRGQDSASLNPAFFASLDQSLTVHYGTHPLLGFPLATAYTPLISNNILYKERGCMSSSEYLCACAYQHFRAWARAFNTTIDNGSVLRFCVADALALTITLNSSCSSEPDQLLTANVPTNNWSGTPLVLDKDQYQTLTRRAPRRFNVIDTSNLIDHLGPLNLIPQCATLLKPESSSTVYTESLVQNTSSEKERVADILGLDARSVALFLRLSPCEIWTNATTSPEDESILHVLGDIHSAKIGGASQIRSRLRWKLTYSHSDHEARQVVCVEPLQAAEFLAKLYNHMFQHENMLSLLQGLDISKYMRFPNVYYNRASFVLLLKQIQRTMRTNWDECVGKMMSMIFDGFASSPLGENYAQELILYMHMLEIDTNYLPAIHLVRSKDAKMARFFNTWSSIPTQVCVTLRVPRDKLRLLATPDVSPTGTPALRCDIEGQDKTLRPWSNIFASIQLAFGNSKVSEVDGIPNLQIDEDASRWFGESDMFASFYVPTWILLQHDNAMPRVVCGLLSTRQNVFAFLEHLGPKLNLFDAEVTSKHVFVSRYMPMMQNLPRLASTKILSNLNEKLLTTGNFSPDRMSIKSLTHRINYLQETEKSVLGDKSNPVQVHFVDTFRARVKVGKDIESSIESPLPVDATNPKIRIARKSSYVEIETQLYSPLVETSKCLLFPTIVPQISQLKPCIPAPWTAARVNLDSFPVIDTSDRKGINWINTHTSMMFSTRERKIRESGMNGTALPGTKPNMRVEVKDGLFSIFMQYTGLQGTNAKAYGLSKEVGGIFVLFLPSCCRLDLASRTIVLDVAAIPLTHVMSKDSKVRSLYQQLSSLGVVQVRTSDDELRCWKACLPAFAERCRLWTHKSECEYSAKEEAPLTEGLEDGQTPLCSCGLGEFPPNYLGDLKLNNLKYILKKYATRMAISPIFAVPYVEDCFLTGNSLSDISKLASSTQGSCAKCGSTKRNDGSGSGGPLLVCSKCRNRKYCSAACQKADWKAHKQACSAS